jgi:hypothetical protein
MSSNNQQQQDPHDSSASSLKAEQILKASDAKEEEAQCRSCVRLLQQVLQSSSSRPAQLLQSLYDSTPNNSSNKNIHSQLPWRVTSNGVDVRIPAETHTENNKAVRRRWSRLHPPEHDDTPADVQFDMSSFLQERQLATSSSMVTRKPSRLHNTSLVSNNKTEWMSLKCQICSSTGPEGGARAFVMGPTPLSIVVCTNRLHATTPQAAKQEMEEILTHELVHVYDVRKLQLDLRDCENLAYSEVRAAREAECRFSWYTRACAKRTAMTATSNLFPHTMAYDCMQKVFETAMKDTRPSMKASSRSNNTSSQSNYTRRKPTSNASSR